MPSSSARASPGFSSPCGRPLSIRPGAGPCPPCFVKDEGGGMKTINIGLVGFGTVGTGVVKLLKGQAPLLERRLAARLRLKRIADLDLPRPGAGAGAPQPLTTHAP